VTSSEKAVRLPDEPGPFREWLGTLPPGHRFKPHRYPGSSIEFWCCGCPLAEYMRSMGAPAPRAGSAFYTPSVGDLPEKYTPNWAGEFISAFDRTTGCGQRDSNPLTALRVLATVTGGVQ